MTDAPTHRDLAGHLGVSVTTIKSYRSKFPGAFVPVSRGKPLRFDPASLEVCRAIRDAFQRGFSIDEIKILLKKLVPGIENDRRLSDGDDIPPAGSPPLPPGHIPDASREIQSQDAARRLGRLEALLGDLLDLTNRTHSLHLELLAKLDALAGVAASRPAALPGGDPGAAAPPWEFASLPVVVMSERGEYLGITARDKAPFSLREFEAHLVRRAGRMAARGGLRAGWRPRADGWVLALFGAGESGEDPETGHEHFFRRTTTPRGNLVALFYGLRINGKDVSEAFLRAFFRQIKDSLE